MCETLKGCVQGCAKVILILINLIAVLAGIALIGVGGFVMAKGKEYLPDVGVSLTPAATCLIILGVLLMLVGGFGCFGACTGRHGLLNVYLALLGIIVILEIAVLIYGFVNKGKVAGTIEEAITIPFNNVNTNGSSADALDLATVDSIQRHATCCGITGPDFWTNVQFKDEVPASCCEDAPSNATLCAKTNAYQDGCLSSTEGLVTKALTLVIVVIVIIVLFQLTCMILAWCSRGEYTEVDHA
ncbi:hypothetical protein ACHWQZ_G014040 [Mnemiopsis leidyi]